MSRRRPPQPVDFVGLEDALDGAAHTSSACVRLTPPDVYAAELDARDYRPHHSANHWGPLDYIADLEGHLRFLSLAHRLASARLANTAIGHSSSR